MKLLITGGAGYIGTHILTELLPLGYEICVVDDFSNSKHKALDQVRILTGKTFEILELNLCDYEALNKICNEFKPEAVIHLAGLKAVSESVQMPLNYYEKNVASSIQLLKALDDCGCKKIIFSSSATVYAAKNTPIDEMQTIQPINPYGRTKYFIEEIINDWTKSDPLKSAVTLRYFNPAGAHKSGKIGEDPNNIPNNLMPLITQVGNGQRSNLDVFGNDYATEDGTAIRDYIHVLDLAKGHLAGLSYVNNNTGHEVFNLGSGTGYSVLAVVKAFEISNGIEIPYRMAPRREGDVCTSVANSDKAARLLSWQPTFTIEEMCEDAWRWQTKNPAGYKN